jgi:hypothetical protein
MSVSAAHAIRSNIGYIGAHALLLVSGIGLLFLQQYLWILNIARQGYGPYQSTPYLTGVSAFVVIVDLVILRWALKGSRGDRYVSLLWPALFFGLTLSVLLANNV